MSLAISNRFGEEVEADAQGVRRIEAETRWTVRGPAPLVEAAFGFLKDFADPVHEEVIHLAFGNSVGIFRVPGLGTLQVVSGKWDETHFDSMLADVARIANELPFAAGSGGPLPYDRSLAARDDLLYHAFVYIRHIVSDSAPRHVQLLPALRTILADPHHVTERHVVAVAPERLKRVDEKTLVAIASGHGAFAEAPGARLPAVLDGYLPRRLPERRSRTTTDTPENRFVKAFLDQVCAVLSRMRDVGAGRSDFSERIREECRGLEALLAPFRRHPLWRDVGPMTHLPGNSTVLQRRRGYRDVFRHFALLRLATRHLPLSAQEARDLIEGKSIAALYEMWSFFQVVDVLRNLLGAPVRCLVPARDHLQVRLKPEVAVIWPCGVRALYNATFSREGDAGRRTYSVELRPDVVIVLPDGAVHVLDAKFKLVRLEDGEEESSRADAKRDDLYKMHAYRDAIVAARSAWILYPGTEQTEYPVSADGPLDGVGAVPLRPEAEGRAALESLLRRMVGVDASVKQFSVGTATSGDGA